MRTPVNAITGASALLALTQLDEEQKELIQLLDTGANHIVLLARCALRCSAYCPAIQCAHVIKPI